MTREEILQNYKSGDEFSALIKGRYASGKINTSNGLVYFCTNDKELNGGGGPNKQGYKYGWVYDEEVTEIKIFPTEETRSTEEFKPGDKIRIIRDACNNSGAPEWKTSLMKGDYKDKVFTVAEVKKGGKYDASTVVSYTLILDTGNPVWACYCELVSESEKIINNYEIY